MAGGSVAPAFAAPVTFPVPTAVAASSIGTPPPPDPWTLRSADALPAATRPGPSPGWAHGYSVVAPPSRDRFTAVNLVVPTQQSLGPRALIWGIVSLVLNVMLVPSIFAIVWGALGVARIRRLREAGVQASGRGTSIAGIVLGGLGIGMSVVWALVVLRLR
ncbi:hypothetical protein [Pseudolysinimonas sp.]|uniref:hypothetical protein n=1 Tax=Pseudolysinimonas sp. TaxID=2680009 RepID=UPI003F80F2AA